MEEKKLTCICCPMGCQLQVTIRDGQVEKVEGNTCKRGAEYGKKEVTNPTRIVTTTVRVHGGSLPGRGKAHVRHVGHPCLLVCRPCGNALHAHDALPDHRHHLLDLPGDLDAQLACLSACMAQNVLRAQPRTSPHASFMKTNVSDGQKKSSSS